MTMLTIDQANSVLQQIGSDFVLNDETFDRLISSVSVSRLTTAISRAKTDSGARMWLYKVIAPFKKEVQSTAPNRSPQKSVAAAPTNMPNDYEQYARSVGSPNRQQTHVNQPIEPRNSTTTQATTQNTKEPDDKKFIGHSVFGSKAALYFGYDKTRTGIHTIRIDAASAIGERKYDWNNKIGIQITANELPVIAALFCGLIERCEFKNHGAKKNKGFKIEVQPGRSGKGKQLFFNVSEAGKPLKAIPVGAEDAFFVRNLVLSQLAKNSPELDGSMLLASLKVFASMHQ